MYADKAAVLSLPPWPANACEAERCGLSLDPAPPNPHSAPGKKGMAMSRLVFPDSALIVKVITLLV